MFILVRTFSAQNPFNFISGIIPWYRNNISVMFVLTIINFSAKSFQQKKLVWHTDVGRLFSFTFAIVVYLQILKLQSVNHLQSNAEQNVTFTLLC